MTFRPVGSGAAMLALALVLGACSATDPSDRAGLWHPRGVNNGNLAAMISNPQDLVRGRGVSYADGALAAAAVDRLYQGKVKALPDTGLALAGVGTGGSNATSQASTDTTP